MRKVSLNSPNSPTTKKQKNNFDASSPSKARKEIKNGKTVSSESAYAVA